LNLFLKCPVCEGEIDMKERYCGMCGFDSITIVDPTPQNDDSQQNEINVKKTTRHLLVVVLLVFMQLSAGGVYWWLNNKTTIAGINENKPAIKTDNSFNNYNDFADLTRAEAYLPKPGVLAKFYQRYPNGEAGVVERVSANIFTSDNTLSEVDLIQNEGKNYGYVYHFIKRPDGVYIIFDQSPENIIPSLKNNLRTGLQWEYLDGTRKTVWTVLETGKSVDLGFINLNNCLLVLEECNEVDYKKIIYYAPGIGRVMEKTATEGDWLMIMTSINSIDTVQAAKTIKIWAVNYEQIEMLNL
jgi:hypothetical protein